MTFNDWHLYTIDRSGVRQGEIADYTTAQFVPVYNDVGAWSFEISADAQQVPNLMLPGYGMTAVRDGVSIMAGPIKDRDYSVSEDGTNTVKFSGSDANIWIARRLAHPVPNDPSPPYTAAQFDVRTGVASTVIQAYIDNNLGPAALSTRQKVGLTMDTDPVVGSSVTGSARWDNLLTFLQTLALNGGVGFRIVQSGSGFLAQTYAPVDRSGTIKFSIGLGNLKGFEYTSSAPTANYVFVGGDGDGTARAINEFSDASSVALYERIEGELATGTGASGAATLSQAGHEALVNGQEQSNLSITPLDNLGQRYMVDYFLGDTVTISLGKQVRTPYGVTGLITDTIQSVQIDLTPGAGVTTSPIIASAPNKMLATLWRDFRQIRKRLTAIERN